MSNVFSCTGIVGRDAEVRYLPSGQAVLNVNVATHVGFGDKEQTIWVRVALWGKRAESGVANYLKKGQHVFISGELSVSEYKGNDGVPRFGLELNANILDLVGKKAENTSTAPASSRPSSFPPPSSNSTDHSANQFDAPYDDDIPF